MRGSCAAFALLVGLAACGDGAAPAPEQARAAALDTVVVSTAPLLPDGTRARVVHALYAAADETPVQWFRTVTAGRDTLFHETGESGDFDALFDNTASFDGCTTPAACRRAWFLGTFAQPTLDTLEAGPLDLYEREIARGYLLDAGRDEIEADRLLDELDAYHENQRRVTIQFTESPTAAGPVWAYHPTLRRLVPVYTD